MNTFSEMESKLKEAGRLMEAARINQRSLNAEERSVIIVARSMGMSAGLSVGTINSYLESGAEQAREVLR